MTDTAPVADRPPLDDRVMANGKPVSRLTVNRKDYGGWVVIVRAKNAEGAVLLVRIPGLHANVPYPEQADAVIGASEIYSEYCRAVEQIPGTARDDLAS